MLSTNYAGGRNKQISLRPEQKKQAERWLANYRDLKDKLEAICEANLWPRDQAIDPFF